MERLNTRTVFYKTNNPNKDFILYTTVAWGLSRTMINGMITNYVFRNLCNIGNNVRILELSNRTIKKLNDKT